MNVTIGYVVLAVSVVSLSYAFLLYKIAAVHSALRLIATRLLEIEDSRPVNKISIVGDSSVPNGSAFALDLSQWKGADHD